MLLAVLLLHFCILNRATGKMRIEQRVKCGSECGRKSTNYPLARI